MTETPMSTFTRQAALLLDRRATAQAITGGGLAALLAPLAGAEAKNKRKKRKRRKKQRNKENEEPQCPEPPACPEPAACPAACAAPFSGCFTRAVGEPLCGTGSNADGCLACQSDQDCVGADAPYCVTTVTNLLSGDTSPIATCPDYDVGVCVRIFDPPT